MFLFCKECGDNWDYSYVNPPENCHKVNEVMREFLREFEIENSDIADICYVQGDQWYIQGHETCIGAYPEVRFLFFFLLARIGLRLMQFSTKRFSPTHKKHFCTG